MPLFLIIMPRKTRSARSTHIQQTQRIIIPDDWDEENDGWCHMVLCVPNSVKWRATITGAIDRLSYGRLWDGNTGNITDAQQVIHNVIESIPMNCNELTRIADTLEDLYDAQFVNIDDVIELLPDGILKTMLESLGEFGEALDFLLPNINLSWPQIRILQTITEALNRQKTFNRMDQQTAMMQAIALGINGQSGRKIIDDLIENQLPNQLVLDLLDLVADQQVGLVDEGVLNGVKPDWLTERLRMIENLNVTVESGDIATNGGSDDMTTIINNYGCGCCGDGQKTQVVTGTQTTVPTNINNPVPLSGPVNQIPPPGFETWSDYLNYKCRAAHHIYEQIRSFFQSFDSGVAALATGGVTDAINFIAGLSYYWMTSESLLAFAQNLYNWATLAEAPETFWSALAGDIADAKDAIICAMYQAEDTDTAIADTLTLLNNAEKVTLASFGLPTGFGVDSEALDAISNLVGTFLMNDLFNFKSDIPTASKTCGCSGDPGPNTGVCYSVNTIAGIGTAQLLSNDGSAQVWRVSPSFEDGVYSADVRSFNLSGAQIAYQVTDVSVNNTPSGGFDLVEYNYEDGSQAGAFAAGCVNNIRYQDTAPGWSIDITVDLTAMDNCAGCQSLPVFELEFVGNLGGSLDPSELGGTGDLTLNDQVRTINSAALSDGGHYLAIQRAAPYTLTEDQYGWEMEIISHTFANIHQSWYFVVTPDGNQRTLTGDPNTWGGILSGEPLSSVRFGSQVGPFSITCRLRPHPTI